MIEVKEELDPIFETVGLLYTARHIEAMGAKLITVLDGLGLNGKNTYQNEFTVYRKYIDIFTENKKTNEYDDFLFGEYDSDFFFMVTEVLIEKRELFSSFGDITSDGLNKEIIYRYSKMYEEEIKVNEISNFEDILAFLTGSELSDSIKWKLANLMRNPRKYYQGLVNLVNDNISAFEKAMNSVGKDLHNYLELYKLGMKKKQDKQFFRLINGMETVQFINPTLIFPATQLLSETNSYYGLLSEQILKIGSDKESEKEALVMKLKALGDSSKFEILLSLKDSPKYNLEMAEALGLSASTMSHHMNALLACGLVGVTKKSGKVYYHIEKSGLEKLKEGINCFFIL